MGAPGVQLIPSPEAIMQILKKTGAFREGHFIYPNGKRSFRQYVNQGEINPCIIVDDIIRSGQAIQETVELVRSLGAPIIGCGAIVRFTSAPDHIDGAPIKSLVEFEEHFYDRSDDCMDCKKGAPEEHVRF